MRDPLLLTPKTSTNNYKPNYAFATGEVNFTAYSHVTNDISADTSDALITYSQSTGSLFYNGNQFAILQGTPTLSYTDLSIYD